MDLVKIEQAVRDYHAALIAAGIAPVPAFRIVVPSANQIHPDFNRNKTFADLNAPSVKVEVKQDPNAPKAMTRAERRAHFNVTRTDAPSQRQLRQAEVEGKTTPPELPNPLISPQDAKPVAEEGEPKWADLTPTEIVDIFGGTKSLLIEQLKKIAERVKRKMPKFVEDREVLDIAGHIKNFSA